MNSLVLLFVGACVAAALASYPDGYDREVRYEYHGRYGGHCGNDGFYYKDHASFVICSNGNAYDQACAPGSRNSGYDHYGHGSHYYYRDFCDVNLVDYGYGAHHEGYGNDGYRGDGYGARGDGYDHHADGYGVGVHADGYRGEYRRDGYGHRDGYGRFNEYNRY